MTSPAQFRDRYGPRALIAGASEGIGAAFARQLAQRGLDLLLVARRLPPLVALAGEIRASHGVDARTAVANLGNADEVRNLAETARAHDVGLVVCNAALAPIGYFVERPAHEHSALIDLNCRSAALLAHAFGTDWLARRRTGGIIFMSSLAGLQGTALTAHYSASKAYLRVLAEGLWDELKPHGIDVLASAAGPTATPGYLSSRPRESLLGSWRVPPVQTADEVVADALGALGGSAVTYPGKFNAAVAFWMRRFMPAGWGIRTVSAATRRMYRR